MGSRMTGQGAEKVYEAAELWVDSALRRDGSLFTPGEAIWTLGNLRVLHEKFLDRPDETKRDFLVKLQEQLSGSSPEVYQLMGEALYTHYLIQDLTLGTKQNRIQAVLGWSPTPVSMPQQLVVGLRGRFVNTSAGLTYIPYQVGTLIETVEQWKVLDPSEQNRLLTDPWAFRGFVFSRQFSSNLLVNNQNTGDLERHLLLHVVHPDHFEAILRGSKERIAKAKTFSHFVTGQTSDPDRAIKQIRVGLEAEMGRGFSFWEEEVLAMWDSADELDPWDEFVKLAQEFIDTGELESQEIDYKLKIAHKLEVTKDAVLADKDNWGELLGMAIAPVQGHPMDWRAGSHLMEWCNNFTDDSLEALRAIWTRNDLSVAERIESFSDMLPKSVISGTGTRMRAISVLMMGIDVRQYPPYMWSTFTAAYRYTGYDEVGWNKNEAGQYEHALGFLDRFIDEAAKRGLTLRNRLDAQSVLWAIQDRLLSSEDNPELPPTEPEDHWSKENMDKLAKELMWPESSDLQDIINGLKDKGQVIFQGPPGTGKTFVAKRLGEWAKENGGDYKIVQFHPSYSYEDFIEGYRPTLSGNQAGFELRDGPLKEIADEADKKSDATFILVIDEINRTNVSKVMGELYFLLEYRGEPAELLYSKRKDFTLPKNLWIIGTMNTTDRSIALVDAALRRRFYFYDFFPNQPPIEGLLHRWLKENDEENVRVAELVDKANKELQDRHLSIGPSHFMKKGEKLNRERVRFIWERSVYPYIEEQLFGRQEDIEKFKFEKLEPILDTGVPKPSEEDEEQGPSKSESEANQ